MSGERNNMSRVRCMMPPHVPLIGTVASEISRPRHFLLASQYSCLYYLTSAFFKFVGNPYQCTEFEVLKLVAIEGAAITQRAKSSR
jgi:hypothetical protein